MFRFRRSKNLGYSPSVAYSRKRERIAGGIYHVMTRGNHKSVIFEDDRDRKRFLKILKTELALHAVQLIDGCLMDTHFHLDLVTPFANLPDFMAQLNGQYARYSAWRHSRSGHLFEGRYRHVVIEDDLHLFRTLAYIYKNPTKGGLAQTLEEYRWSTYRATAGLTACPSYQSVEWLTVLFPSATLQDAQRALREVMAETSSYRAYLRKVENDASAQARRSSECSYVEQQRRKAAERIKTRPPLSELMEPAVTDIGRFTYVARAEYGYKVTEIARALKLSRAQVSRSLRAHLRKAIP